MKRRIREDRKTDMGLIKDVAISLLFQEVVPNDKIPFIVHHPFTNSRTVMVPVASNVVNVNEDGSLALPDIIDIVDDAEGRSRWMNYMKDRIQDCREVWQILMMLNKPYYFAFIKFTHNYMSKKDLASVLAHAWVSVEYSNDDANLSPVDIIELMESVDKRDLMTKDDYESYESLPDNVTVYRGVTKFNENRCSESLSWTLDTDVAKFFANRFNTGTGKIYSKTINKSDIVAYFNTRNEKEIIIRPNSELELYSDLTNK